MRKLSVAVVIAATVAGAGAARSLPALSTASTAKNLYEAARRAEARLRESDAAMRSEENWTSVGAKYRAVVLSWPRSGYCDDALHYEGGIYRDAAERFDNRRFAVRAADAYRLLSTGYPTSKWAPRALYEQVRLHAALGDRDEARRAAEQLRRRAPEAAETQLAEALLAPSRAPARSEPEPGAVAAPPRPRAAGGGSPAVAGGPPAFIENIRHWVGDSHTRVVIDLSRPAPHTEGRLTNPDRVFFDLHGVEIAEELTRREFPIEGSHLRRIRVGAPEPEVARVVLDFSSVREVTVFGLPNPYRLVVDIHGAPPVAVAEAPPPEPEAAEPPATGERPEPPGAARATPGGDEAPALPERTESGYSVARQLGAGVRRIVIDAGHGGKDPGTHAGRLREKDIALDISKRVRDNLEETGFEVVMTRDRDVFLPLEQRAFIANDVRADLFVSIHVNAARNRNARGLETFYLNLATSPDAAEVAARENAVMSEVRIADIPRLVEQIMNHTRIEESRELAGTMQTAMAEHILGDVDHPLNRGVKTAGFHVLLGARMPAILVEVGFVSNREEARLLREPAHRGKLADAITEGVVRYAETLGQTTDITAAKSGS